MSWKITTVYVVDECHGETGFPQSHFATVNNQALAIELGRGKGVRGGDFKPIPKRVLLLDDGTVFALASEEPLKICTTAAEARRQHALSKLSHEDQEALR